uniref:Uncharacterized protein n=1 Tax=Panagrellus redivivus TaxID=6233 RepID=A0A7E4V265_PANRE
MQPRIREIPIERVPPAWTNGAPTDPGRPSDARYRPEVTIMPGAVYSPPSTLPSNRTVFPQTQKRHIRPHNFQNQQLITGDPIPRTSPSSTLSYGPTPNSSISSSASLSFRKFPTSQDSLRRRQRSPEASGSGFKTVATYGLADQPHSTASTPSGAPTRHISPQPVAASFVAEPRGTRSGSLPHSNQTSLLPSHYLRYRPAAALPVMQPEYPSPVPSSRDNNHHSHHVQAVPAEIVATGMEEDPEVAADRAEPDYHLVESGSDVQLAQRANVPAPAPRDGRPSASNGPETDILDSSCSSSDTEDDVVRNCDGESDGNAPGLKFAIERIVSLKDSFVFKPNPVPFQWPLVCACACANLIMYPAFLVFILLLISK